MAGPDAAPAVLLLHGLAATADLNWGGCYDLLTQEFRIIAPDLRGHGHGVRGPFTLESCADDVAALVELVHPGPVIVAGYSMGGPVTTLLWRRHPGLVAGMVLCATAPFFVVPRVHRAVLAGLGALAPAAGRAARGVGRASGWVGLSDMAAGLFTCHDLGAIAQAVHALVKYRADGWLGGVNVPSAVVQTRRDHVVPPARQLRLIELIPGCSLFSIEGGHDIVFTNPETFGKALLAAVSDVVARLPVADAASAGSRGLAA
jgi:pimeloyl-ACP methyl ester carboxylesterase